MKKTILVISALVIVVLGGLIWHYLVPPSGKSYCQKVHDLSVKEIAATGVSKDNANQMVEESLGSVDKCAKSANSSERGLLYITKFRRCVLKASSLAEAQNCSQTVKSLPGRGSSTSTTEDTETQPTTAPATSSKLTFEKTVNLNEDVEVEFQMKKGTQNTTGKATFKISEIGEVNKIGSVNAITGQTFYYVVYEFTGDKNNPAGVDITPKALFEPSAPQVVLIDENTLPSIGGSMGGAYDSDMAAEKKLTTNIGIKMTQNSAVKTVSTWYTKKVAKPAFAVQYTDTTGVKKYIKINE